MRRSQAQVGRLDLHLQPPRRLDGDLRVYEGEYVSTRGEARTLAMNMGPEPFAKLGRPNKIILIGADYEAE